MRDTVKRAIRITGGILLLGLGVLGLFLPILQGWLFLGMGLLLLFPKDTRMGRRIRAWLKEKQGDLKQRIDARLGRKGSRDASAGDDGDGGDEDQEGPPTGGGPTSGRRQRPF
mgnify:CR=1 FL=1